MLSYLFASLFILPISLILPTHNSLLKGNLYPYSFVSNSLILLLFPLSLDFDYLLLEYVNCKEESNIHLVRKVKVHKLIINHFKFLPGANLSM